MARAAPTERRRSVPFGSVEFLGLSRIHAFSVNCGLAFGGTSGSGAVYKLDATGNETVLYSFTGGADSAIPLFVFDQQPDVGWRMYGGPRLPPPAQWKARTQCRSVGRG